MHKSFMVKTPASCGEMIQGFYGEEEMLISYPIDLFSEVHFSYKGEDKGRIGSKSLQAIEVFFEETALPRTLFNSYRLSVINNIPIGKGMASSTADISGVLCGLYHLYDLDLCEEKLAELCCRIEPTDSTIFRKITLFDHINGKRIESFDWQLSCDVLVLEPDYQINTTDFRKAQREQLLKKNTHSKALNLFKKAEKKQSIWDLKASTHLSAVENQEILEKPYFQEINQVSESLGCYGINVAHSGSVVAILYDQEIITEKSVLEALEKTGCLSYYKRQYTNKMIQGGSKIMEA